MTPQTLTIGGGATPSVSVSLVAVVDLEVTFADLHAHRPASIDGSLTACIGLPPGPDLHPGQADPEHALCPDLDQCSSGNPAFAALKPSGGALNTLS